jgi:hypothetical protein
MPRPTVPHGRNASWTACHPPSACHLAGRRSPAATEDPLRNFMELAQAITNDFDKFESMVASKSG